MKKCINVSIAIPAYFAEKNIYRLISSLIRQNENEAKIKEIIIFSDGSTDNTVKNARNIKDKRIRVIDSKKRGGFALGIIKITSLFRGDVVLLLNDDIYIRDLNFVNKIVKPLINNKKIGLISGNPQPLNPKNFVENAGINTFKAYEQIRYSIRDGNNKHTCDGKVLLLTRKLIRRIKFPDDKNDMGNVDAFLYFSCLSNNFEYKHVRDAIVWYKYPNNIKDYISWNTRNNSNKYILRKQFGDLVDKEYFIPSNIKLKALATQFLKDPVSSIYIFLVGQYCKFRAKKTYKSFTQTWDLVISTKSL